jgi:hypothetical protein
MPILEPFLSLFCHFDGFHSAENLGGIEQIFEMFLFKIWKKNNISSPGMRGTPFHHFKSNPLKRSANVRGVVKTQILPNICCQILHLCISYSNKTGFTHCAIVRLKCHQFSTMVWPTSESSRGPETHYLWGF